MRLHARMALKLALIDLADDLFHKRSLARTKVSTCRLVVSTGVDSLAPSVSTGAATAGLPANLASRCALSASSLGPNGIVVKLVGSTQHL